MERNKVRRAADPTGGENCLLTLLLSYSAWRKSSPLGDALGRRDAGVGARPGWCFLETETVAKTRAEQLEYGRGYNRGVARARDHIKAVIEIAKGYRRAVRGEGPEESLCKNCARWTRGEGHAFWGRCRADFEWDLEPRMWADAWPAKEKAEIITQPEFGCVSWIPRQTPGA